MAMKDAVYFSVRESARKAINASVPHYPHPAYHGVLLDADRDIHYRHPSLYGDDYVGNFQERSFLRRRGVPFRG